MDGVPDVTRPSMARVRGYLAGGKDNYAADREMAARLEAVFPAGDGLPLPRRMARANLEWCDRAVRYAAALGVDQFAQFDAGLPPPPPFRAVHESAPGARTVYVDDDPVALVRIRALIPGAVAVEGTAARAGEVLRSEEFAAAIDVRQPWCALFAMTAHLMPPEAAREATAACVAVMPPGSVLAVTVPLCDDVALWERVRAACTAGELWRYSREDVAALFGGTKLVAPGLVPATAWRPERPSRLEPNGPMYVFAAAGIRR